MYIIVTYSSVGGGGRGTANPADAFTKHLEKTLFRSYMAVLYNTDPSYL